MATVSSTPRTTRIELASPSSGPFEVGFRMFDPALNVYVDGLLVESGYTTTYSPTNGYDDDATITFSGSLPSGTVIQIDSALAPMRGSDYVNPDPGLTEKLNIELARIWSAVSDINQQARRSVRALEGLEPLDGMTTDLFADLPALLADIQVATNGFSTRAGFVTANSLDPGVGMGNGTVIIAGGLGYQRQSAATVISDLPGWVPNGEITPQHFGAAADGVTDDTAEINAALAALVAVGGGTLYFPVGTYLVSNFNLTTATWDNEVAIHVLNDNIHLRGAGRGATVLKLANSGNATVVKFGRRLEGVVAVGNCSIRDMSIDGNRANQVTPTDTDDHYSGVEVASGCQRITIADLYIYNAAYYGIGFQRDNIRDCVVENVVIENTGGDGFDGKNDSGTGRGNVLRNVTVIAPGLLTALTNSQAGFDLRSGYSISNCLVSMGAVSDNRGVRTLGDGDGTAVTSPDFPTSISGVTVVGSGQASSVGVEIGTRGAVASDFVVTDCGLGLSIVRSDVSVSNPAIYDCPTGIRLTQDSATVLEGDTTAIMGGIVRGSTTTGVNLNSVDSVSIMGLNNRGTGAAGTGYSVSSGCTGVKIIGGSCTGFTTLLSDNGTSTVVQSVDGLKTAAVGTTSVSITVATAVSFTIAHGLNVTPDTQDVDLQLRRNTNVGDAVFGALWVTSVDATNVNGQLIVSTPSATGGAVVDVIMRVRAKHI